MKCIKARSWSLFLDQKTDISKKGQKMPKIFLINEFMILLFMLGVANITSLNGIGTGSKVKCINKFLHGKLPNHSYFSYHSFFL